MEISSVQHQAMATHLGESLSCPRSDLQQEKKPRPHPEQALKCPRCSSTNTKFCYYNNYSLSQPRYFCKGCRRYWTKGGSLRNVPVGGGCRKNKRSSSSSSPSSSSSSSSKKSQPDQDLTPPPLLPALPLPPLSFDPSDLTLAFANDTTFMLGNPNPNPNPNPTGFLDILRNPSGSFQSMYYGFGGNGGGGKEVEGAGVGGGDGHLMMFPNFDGGLVSSCTNAETMTATETTVVEAACSEQSSCKGLMDQGVENNKGTMGMGLHQWPVGGGDHGSSLGLDWNGVGPASSWYGLINSSLM